MDGDDMMRKLAQSVENMVQTGTASVNVTTGGSASTLAITFPVAFAAPPTVVVTPSGSSPNIGAMVATTPTATAVTIAAYRATAGAQVVYWVAIGPVVPVN
jgi:NAD-dependent dihydropyrimidine dehydrogenase PreA subunit